MSRCLTGRGAHLRGARWGRVCGLVWLAWVGSTAPLWGQTPDGLELLEEAARRYQGVRSLCTTFRQRLEVRLLGDVRTGRGRLCQAAPDRFAMRFSDPPGDVVVMDGTWLWLYYPSIDTTQVIRVRAGVAESEKYDLVRAFLRHPAGKYRVSYVGREEEEGRVLHRLRLVPRRPAGFRAAELWLDAADWTLVRIRIEEENETVRTLTFTDVVLNPPDLTPEFFRFEPPPGTQVISG